MSVRRAPVGELKMAKLTARSERSQELGNRARTRDLQPSSSRSFIGPLPIGSIGPADFSTRSMLIFGTSPLLAPIPLDSETSAYVRILASACLMGGCRSVRLRQTWAIADFAISSLTREVASRSAGTSRIRSLIIRAFDDDASEKSLDLSQHPGIRTVPGPA